LWTVTFIKNSHHYIVVTSQRFTPSEIAAQFTLDAQIRGSQDHDATVKEAKKHIPEVQLLVGKTLVELVGFLQRQTSSFKQRDAAVMTSGKTFSPEACTLIQERLGIAPDREGYDPAMQRLGMEFYDWATRECTDPTFLRTDVQGNIVAPYIIQEALYEPVPRKKDRLQEL
jgi:hypothetical protein